MGLFDDVYKEIGIIKSKGESAKVLNLMKTPKKTKGVNKPHYQAYRRNASQQADLLFLPSDNGYRYALVVIDNYSRYADAQPLKSKKAKEVLQAFLTIYKRGFVRKPQYLQIDSGSEFSGVVKKYFKDHDTAIRVGKPGRHSQEATVEQMNHFLGKMIFAYQNSIELETGKKTTEWVRILPRIIHVYNKERKKQLRKRPNTQTAIGGPLCAGATCDLLTVGTLVRIPLDRPIAIPTGKRLHGEFRSGDIRYEEKPRKIMQVYINPGMPPMYRVSGIRNVAYTKEELQVYDAKETGKPRATVKLKPVPQKRHPRKNAPPRYKGEIESFVDQLKEGRSIHYLVKWRGKPSSDNTWVPRKDMLTIKYGKQFGFGSNKKSIKASFERLRTELK